MRADKAKKRNIKSIAFVIACVTACIAACVLLFCLNITPTVALEQEIRCGIEEHTHIDACYEGDFLTCGRAAHTHDGNCYIILLKENNINNILALLENSETHSLEHVIADTMTSALHFNANMNSTELSGSISEMPLTQDTVVQMNTTISGEETLPNIVLNENINTPQAVADSEDTTDPPSNSNVTLDIEKDPSTATYSTNFYIYLDGEWMCIGTLPYTTTANGSRYDYTIPTSDVLDLVNGVLGTEYVYNSFDIAVSTSRNSGYTISNVGMGSVTTTVAYRQRNTAAKSARYVRLIPNNGAANSVAFAFYTVTFQYPDGRTVERVVRSGTTVTLPDGNYEWSNGNRTYAAGEAVTVTGVTTFTGTTLGPITFINVHYDVNFPTVSGVTVATKPTLAGLSSATVTDGYMEGTAATVRNVSQQSVAGKVNNNSTGLSRVVQFKGWKVSGSDVILQPNTTLVWEELLQYATGSALHLTAVWEYAAVQTATFFIRFDSVAVDTDGNITGQDSNKYTNELFAAYVGGIDTSLSASQLHQLYHIADTTSDNS